MLSLICTVGCWVSLLVLAIGSSGCERAVYLSAVILLGAVAGIVSMATNR